jgi:hypothetical protein
MPMAHPSHASRSTVDAAARALGAALNPGRWEKAVKTSGRFRNQIVVVDAGNGPSRSV